jgi:hypothetical protein
VRERNRSRGQPRAFSQWVLRPCISLRQPTRPQPRTTRSGSTVLTKNRSAPAASRPRHPAAAGGKPRDGPSSLGHEFERPRVEVVKDLLQPRDPLVEARRPPPMPDRIHAPPRTEADEPAGVVGIPQQLRPARPDPANRSSRQAPPSDARTRPRDPASRTTSTAYRSHPQSPPPRAWYGLAPPTTVSAQTRCQDAVHAEEARGNDAHFNLTRSIAANRITFVKDAASLPSRSHVYGFWLRGGLGSDTRARMRSLKLEAGRGGCDERRRLLPT